MAAGTRIHGIERLAHRLLHGGGGRPGLVDRWVGQDLRLDLGQPRGCICGRT